MGGDRTCPDDCPLAVWANLSATDRKAQRKPIAEKLYKEGFTMEQIATQLGVSHVTISNDLQFVSDLQIKKPAKSATNPKGAGRPRGKKKQATADKHEKIIALHDAGMKPKEIAALVGYSDPRMVDRVLEVEHVRRDAHSGELPPEELSKTAQQKLESAIRQHKLKLDAEFDIRVRAEMKRYLDDVALPSYLKEIKEIERTIRDRRGIMDRVTYRKILSCLHPDRVADEALKKRFEEAFRLFTDLEKRVLNEKESPTTFRNVPRTAEELLREGDKKRAERAAKRAAKTGVNIQ
jgi:IS30 family transposase